MLVITKTALLPSDWKKRHLAFQVKTNLNATLLFQSEHSSLFLSRKIWLHRDLAAWTKHQEVSLTIERPRFNMRSERIATPRYQARSQRRYGPDVGSFSKSHVMGSKVSLLWLCNLRKPSYSRILFLFDNSLIARETSRSISPEWWGYIYVQKNT